MFVIKDMESGIYFARNNKIITFEDPNFAADFANAFLEYSLQRMMQENPFGVMEVHKLSNTIKIIEADFNTNTVETISFYDLCDDRK
jgi:hypothetical protein